MGKTIAKNIIFRDHGSYRYKVDVSRDYKVIIESFETFEEALAARDEIIETYNSTGVLKHSSAYEDRNLLKARKRFDGEKVLRIDDRYAAQCNCSRCNKQVTFLEFRHYERFISRDRLCLSCCQSDHVKAITSEVKKKDIPFRNNTTTGIKNVYFDRSTDTYRVSIVRDGRRLSLRAKTLKTAIYLKKQVLSFYHSYGHLPSSKEMFI